MKKRNGIALFGSVKILVFAAMLCAISGIMKLIAPSGDTWRISFENFPIIFGGMMFGPMIGGAIGIVSDLLGCLFRGYAIIPFITIASMFVGLTSGVVFKLIKKDNVYAVVTAVFSAHIISSILIKTIVLSKTYGMPFGVLLAERSVTYFITAAVESLIIVILYNNKAIKSGLKRVIGK